MDSVRQVVDAAAQSGIGYRRRYVDVYTAGGTGLEATIPSWAQEAAATRSAPA
jgi:hypothetical protein